MVARPKLTYNGEVGGGKGWGGGLVRQGLALGRFKPLRDNKRVISRLVLFVEFDLADDDGDVIVG